MKVTDYMGSVYLSQNNPELVKQQNEFHRLLNLANRIYKKDMLASLKARFASTSLSFNQVKHRVEMEIKNKKLEYIEN